MSQAGRRSLFCQLVAVVAVRNLRLTDRLHAAVLCEARVFGVWSACCFDGRFEVSTV